ncbi:MAG: DUF368 domain-containing protein [Planctomycetota bacterium]
MTRETLARESGPQEDEESPPKAGFITAGVGVLMGAADIVPGVSGGTVALVLGVYQRLLNSLARFDATTLKHLVAGRIGDAWRRTDGRFLLTLGAGVIGGAKGLASVMSYLLTDQRTLTFAAFFGLIAASGWLVAKMSRPANPTGAARCVAAGTIAATLAVWLLSQGRLQPVDGLPYTFFCGAVAICAMILPGISGAYLLLMLGKYEEVSDILHRFPQEVTGADIATLAVFATGCGFGLLSFSRLLKWLLSRYWSETMAVLAGFMVGSLYRVWPFQIDTTPEVEELKRKVFQPAAPEGFGATELACLTIAVGAAAVVLVADAAARRIHPTAESIDA